MTLNHLIEQLESLHNTHGNVDVLVDCKDLGALRELQRIYADVPEKWAGGETVVVLKVP